jgi:hypothetical protein
MIAVWIVSAVMCGVPATVLAWHVHPSAMVVTVGCLGSVAGGWSVARRVMELGRTPQPLSSAGRRDLFTRGAVVAGVVQWLAMGSALYVTCLLVLSHAPPAWFWFVVTLPLGYSEVLVAGAGYDLVSRAPVLSFGSGAWYDGVRERYAAPPVVDSRSVGPRDVWRHHIGLRLFLGLLVGCAFALYLGPMMAWWLGPLTGALFAFTSFLWTGVNAALAGNLAVATALTAVQLHVEEGTPVRLMRFLEDARRRNLLRATGPVYQFRHIRLQERLSGRA